MHALDESSPVCLETSDSLRNSEARFVLNMSGNDESTGQTLSTQTEYSNGDICCNTTFRDIRVKDADGLLQIDYAKFNQVDPLPDASPSTAQPGPRDQPLPGAGAESDAPS
jgi:hypothetical protein